MPGEDGYFDERIAARYDDDAAATFDHASIDSTVGLLAELAGEGRALEFGIGTGRIALPLSERGIEVHGVDLSSAMVEKLREKPNSERIEVTVGDLTTTVLPQTFSLVYIVFNTIENLTTQEAQVACFRNAARHLEPGGCFVVEVEMPGPRRLPPGETFRVFNGEEDYWGIDEYDVVTQRFFSHHLWIEDGRFERFSAPYRYAWPSELDLMAQLAGMRLENRWSGWNKEPFTSESQRHISVWRRDE